MSDIVKWGLLVAGAVIIIGLIVALPFVNFINVGEFGKAVTDIVTVCSDYFQDARGLVNCFLSDFGIGLVTGLMGYWFTKRFVMIAIKTTVWIYHFIFK